MEDNGILWIQYRTGVFHVANGAVAPTGWGVGCELLYQAEIRKISSLYLLGSSISSLLSLG